MKFALPKPLAGNIASAALIVGCAIGLYLLAARFHIEFDATRNSSNSLEPASIKVLQQLHGPVRIVVFSNERDAQQGDIRKLIRQFVALYQRYDPEITLAFIDPATHPEEARQAEIQANGEMVVEYAGRREHLTTLNEQALTNALLSLAHRREQLVMYVDGHGERKLDGKANYDLGDFGRRLGQLGFRIAPLNLAVAQDVPDNVSVLVITQPQADWLPGEMDKLTRFVSRGGNMLWFIDAEPMHRLEPLAEKLGLVLTPGIVIDPDAEQMRAPVTWALGVNYPLHPITSDFNYATAFPFARSLGHEGGTWRYTPLVDAAPHGWVTTRPPKNDGRPRFDKNRDIPGPVTLALALEREINGHDQRIVAVGSGSFLANTYAGNGRNLDLGVNMVNWLGGQDDLITIAPRAAKDDTVTLSKLQLGILGIGLVIAVPALLALTGGWVWWRRRI